jgi:hypothetical protein
MIDLRNFPFARITSPPTPGVVDLRRFPPKRMRELKTSRGGRPPYPPPGALVRWQATHNDVDLDHRVLRKTPGRKPYETTELQTKLRNHLIKLPTLSTLSRAERSRAAGKFVRRELAAMRLTRSPNWIRLRVIKPVLVSLPPPRN